MVTGKMRETNPKAVLQEAKKTPNKEAQKETPERFRATWHWELQEADVTVQVKEGTLVEKVLRNLLSIFLHYS